MIFYSYVSLPEDNAECDAAASAPQGGKKVSAAFSAWWHGEELSLFERLSIPKDGRCYFHALGGSWAWIRAVAGLHRCTDWAGEGQAGSMRAALVGCQTRTLDRLFSFFPREYHPWLDKISMSLFSIHPFIDILILHVQMKHWDVPSFERICVSSRW